MKRQIRKSVWETNSSSVNTLTIMSKKEFEDWEAKWDDPNWVWDNEYGKWVGVNDMESGDEYSKYRYSPNPCEDSDGWCTYEMKTEEFTTEHGDEIVAVSIYGYDG